VIRSCSRRRTSSSSFSANSSSYSLIGVPKSANGSANALRPAMIPARPWLIRSSCVNYA